RIHGNEVLIEKYVYKPGTRSYRRARDTLGDDFEFIRAGRAPGDEKYTQPPELLVIEPTGGYFFAEVKVGTDRLSPSQRIFFAEITRRTGRKVVLVQVEVLRGRSLPRTDGGRHGRARSARPSVRMTPSASSITSANLCVFATISAAIMPTLRLDLGLGRGRFCRWFGKVP